MADNINNNNGGSNAVWITILIIAIIAVALYFGYFKNRSAAPSTNVNVTLPNVNDGASAPGSGTQ